MGGTKPLNGWPVCDRTLAAKHQRDVDDGGADSRQPLVVRGRTVLFRAPYFENVHAMYDVSRDGKRFVMVTGGARSGRLVVALDVLPEGRRRP